MFSVLWLFGCPFVDDPSYEERVRDADRDGVRDARFGGPDCADANPDVGRCDEDGDGFKAVPWGDDCDDDDALVHPEATERCNGADDDCDGLVDDDDDVQAGLTTYFVDDDRDGVGDAAVEACQAPPGTAVEGGDCDDADPQIFPGATEFCDEVDSNCDGSPDNGAADRQDFAPDADGDGWGAGPTVTACEPPAGHGALGDCADNDAHVRPDAPEVCNAIDDDCDGLVDDEDVVTGTTVWSIDNDGDLAGAVGTDVALCSNPSTPQTQYVQGAGIDCDDVDPNAVGLLEWWPDEDGDGYGASNSQRVVQCGAPANHARNALDCDDGNVTVNPASQEICNGEDDDCDGVIDDTSNVEAWYQDSDGDGFGDVSTALLVCAAPGADWTRLPGDCDETRADVNPGAVEVCGGHPEDEDCDGLFDEDDPNVQLSTYYLDADGDGFGVLSTNQSACAAPPLFVDNADDCDDTDAEVFLSVSVVAPGAPDLQDIVLASCDGAAVLFEPGDHALEGLGIPDRSLFFTALDSEAETRFVPGRPDIRMFGVAQQGDLVVQHIDFAPSSETGPGSSHAPMVAPLLVGVSSGAELTMIDVQISGFVFMESGIDVSPGGSLNLERVLFEDLVVGPKAAVRLQSVASILVDDAEVVNVQAATPATGQGVWITAATPRSFLVRGAEVSSSGLQSGVALIKIDRAAPVSPRPELRELNVEGSGTVLYVNGSDLALVGNHWRGVGDPALVFGESHASPGLGEKTLGVSNSVFIQSGTFELGQLAQLDLQNNAFVHPSDPVLRGVSLPCAPSTDPGVKGFVSQNLFLGHHSISAGPIHGSFLENRLDSDHTAVLVREMIPCTAAEPSYTHSVSEMDLVRYDPLQLHAAIPLPFVDFHEQTTMSAMIHDSETLYGLTGGPNPASSWVEDTDGDLVADGYEYLFHDTLDNPLVLANYEAHRTGP